MNQPKGKSTPPKKTCNSFEEWQAYYLPEKTEHDLTESMRSNTSKLAVTLANRSVDELLSEKALNK